MPRRRIAALTLTGLVVLGACGGDDSDGDELTADEVERVLATFDPPPAPGTPTTVAGGPDPCELVSTSEIEDILGRDADEPGGSGGSECIWLLPNAPTAGGSVSVLVYTLEGAEEATRFFGQLRDQWPSVLLENPDIGEDAFYYSIGKGSTGQIQSLWVRSGPHLVKVFAYEYDDAVEIAKLAVGRLPES